MPGKKDAKILEDKKAKDAKKVNFAVDITKKGKGKKLKKSFGAIDYAAIGATRRAAFGR